MKTFATQTLSLVLATLAFTGCASMKFDEARTKQVKRLAILSVEVQQALPADNLGISKFKELKSGRPGDSEDYKLMAKNIHDGLGGLIAKRTGWQTIPVDRMASQSDYKAKVDKAMSGLRSTSMVDKNTEIVFAKGTIDNAAFRKMSHAERAALARSLGADAFASVVVYSELDQSMMSFGHLSGDAAFTVKSRANMDVYALDTEEPIWRVQNIDGDETESSSDLPKEMPKIQKQAQLGQKAALSALEKLVAKYGSK